MHSGPLGLVQHLLNVAPLPFGSISAKDRELMQLKTVLEGHLRDTSLWSLDHLLQPKSHAGASCGKHNPIGTANHRTGYSSVACMCWELPCHAASGNLGASVGFAQSPPCGHPHQHPMKQCDAGLKGKAAKSLFCAHEIEYLGYILTRVRIKPQPKKVQAILLLNPPNNVKEL